MSATRTETDSIGAIEVPATAYWGAQTERSRTNFPFGPQERMPLPIIHALARVKKAAARVNRAHGLEATFMSKPFGDQSGSGLHIHASLIDAAGRNVFDETTPDGDRMLGHAIAGLQATTYDAMGFFAPNINAYRRFAANLADD